MNWKTRQLFSDREHGIVSGLSPVNMMGGGSVPIPGYEDGGTVGALREGFTEPMQSIAKTMGIQSTPISAQGAAMSGASPAILRSLGFEGATEAVQEAEEPSIEQRVAELAANLGISVPAARAMILNQMLEQQGVTLPEEVINQFATGLITLHEALSQAVGGGAGAALREGVTEAIQGMQAGTGLEEAMSIDLFQQGDEDINQALNMMSVPTGPDIPAEAPIAEAIDEETALMDQGPITETVEELSIEEEPGGYEIELQVLKRAFKDDIRSYVSEGGSGDLEEYLGQMNVVYSNQLDELKRKYGVTEYSPEEELITPDFMSELEALASVPGFQPGGIDIFDETVIAGMDNATLQTALDSYFEGKQPVDARLWRQVAPDGRKVLAIEVLGGGAGAGTGTGLADALAALKQEKMTLASEIGEAARSGYSSVQDPVGHFFSARKAGKTAELGAREKVLADQTALLARLSGSAGAPTSIMEALTAAESEMVTGVGSNKFELQKQKHKQAAWTNILRGEQGNPKPGGFMRAMKLYLLMYNTPPEGFKNSIASDWEGMRIYKGKQWTWKKYMDDILSNIANEADYITALSGWLILDRVEE